MVKYALITGCTPGGIGHDLATKFHEHGIAVIATAMEIDVLSELKKHGLNCLTLDVTKQESIRNSVQAVKAITGGHLDILVNNAGISYPFSAADMDMNKVRELFEVNLFGAMEMVQQYLPLLLKSEDARIVQMGSLAGVTPLPFGAAYNSSKAALHSFGDTLRLELAPFGIKVITIVAGTVKSQISKPHWKLPEGSLYSLSRDMYQELRINNMQDGSLVFADLQMVNTMNRGRNGPRSCG